MISFRVSCLMLACFGMTACATGPQPIGTAPGIEQAELTQLPAPSPADFGPSADLLLVQPLDKLQINVFGVPELSREFRVGADGAIDYPLIGEVQAFGRSSSEIAQEIERRLRGPYVLEPEVSVDVTERTERLITIGGEVQTPGRYPVIITMSLLEAVAVGGGTSVNAELEDVLIFRELNGQQYIGAYNLKAIQRGNYPDPQVYPEDIIMVGNSPARQRLQGILAVAPLITTPLILINQLLR